MELRGDFMQENLIEIDVFLEPICKGLRIYIVSENEVFILLTP